MTEMIVKEIHSDEQVALTDRPSAICCWSSLKPCTPLTSKLPGLRCAASGKAKSFVVADHLSSIALSKSGLR